MQVSHETIYWAPYVQARGLTGPRFSVHHE